LAEDSADVSLAHGVNEPERTEHFTSGQGIGSMAGLNLRTSQREWNDWLGIILGIAIVLAPWIVEEVSNSPAIVNAAIVGVIIMVLAEADLVNFRRWIEICQLAAGIWVAVSPIIFDYADSGALRFLHVLAGLAVAILSILELRQSNGAKARER
jgi:hypothetical protein